MKKIFISILFCVMTFVLVSCGGNEVKEEINNKVNENVPQNININGGSNIKRQSSQNVIQNVDIDLTKMSSTMVYSAVNELVTYPNEFTGKVVKMKGTLNVFKTDKRNYYNCLISDATACCSQGIEFVLKDNKKYPDDYPKDGTEIVVTGVFDTYFEGKNQYYQLINAVMKT